MNLFWEHSRGYVTTHFRAHHQHLKPVTEQSLDRAQRKYSVTVVAITSQLEEAQALLPQVLIIPESIISVRELASLRRSLDRNMYVLVRKSKWVTQEIMAEILRILPLELDRYLPAHQLILTMDGCTVHCTERVLAAAREHNIWVAMIPAGLTWLLQPLDTHIFKGFKTEIRQRFRLQCIEQAARVPERRHCYAIILDSIRSTLTMTTWSNAFSENGFDATLTNLSARILTDLRWVAPPVITGHRVSLDQLKVCLPSNRRVQERGLLELPFGPNLYQDPQVPVRPPRVRRAPGPLPAPELPGLPAAPPAPVLPPSAGPAAPAAPASPEILDLSDHDTSSVHSHGVHEDPDDLLGWT